LAGPRRAGRTRGARAPGWSAGTVAGCGAHLGTMGGGFE
jgi:hypothetical protein